MSKLIAIGKLKKRLDIQTFTEVPSAQYATTKTWTTTATVWGNIEPIKGSVYFASKQIGENVTHKIIVRFPASSITTENWVLHNSIRYRIRAVRNLAQDNRYIELMCEEEETAS